ncbi:MAG: NADH:ubiquinone reductase (Na(+)-transporting) subunit F [Planctomycetota bacterium]
MSDHPGTSTSATLTIERQPTTPPVDSLSPRDGDGRIVEEPHDFIRDYCLVGQNTELAIERGLTDAEWYQSPVPKNVMRELLHRRDWPAIRDTVIWFGIMGVLAVVAGVMWWQGGVWTLLSIVPFMLYGTIYASTSDARWHESSHGTAFKTDWLNAVLYEISSFMVARESILWRWSHTRHHSDTIIVGRDPEIAVMRPAHIPSLIAKFLGLKSVKNYIAKLAVHSTGKLQPEEQTYVPEDQWAGIYLRARTYVAIYAALFITTAVLTVMFGWRGLLPLLLIGLPNIYGAWLMPVYSVTQHAGLAENVLDHRLNCRTVYMNFINRFFYWNMNYHIEHHMFPLVPYYNLPRLHEIIKDDSPPPYPSIYAAWKEIIPAVLKQAKDPGYYIRRRLPERVEPTEGLVKSFGSAGKQINDGWIEVCDADELHLEDVVRFDHGPKTFAIYRTADDHYYATDGMCTHGRSHLAEGFVKGNLIECAKHNGRFDIRDGSVAREPVCVGLQTYELKNEDGKLLLNLLSAGGAGAEVAAASHKFRVVSNDNVATFIKELVLEPIDGTQVEYEAGQYIQLDIPSYERIDFTEFDVPEPFDKAWKGNHVFDEYATNPVASRRNYSLASKPGDAYLRFNVRIATPPRGQDCPAGSGSSYVWKLKAGDEVTAIGPFGDFLIKDSDAEMVYIGGGAGMAPLRSHLSHLLENLKSGRKVSYWYGGRSKQELFYTEYFEDLAARYPNFSFHVALSEPLDEDAWDGPTGFIHKMVEEHHLSQHEKPADIEYYLCGPPLMVQAVVKMLDDYHVRLNNILRDEF